MASGDKQADFFSCTEFYSTAAAVCVNISFNKNVCLVSCTRCAVVNGSVCHGRWHVAINRLSVQRATKHTGSWREFLLRVFSCSIRGRALEGDVPACYPGIKETRSHLSSVISSADTLQPWELCTPYEQMEGKEYVLNINICSSLPVVYKC